MDERATGLILRTYPLTETSLILHWLTPEFGRLATVAKGARRPKSPYRGKLDLFFEADFSFIRSRRSTLHALREVSLRDPHGALRHDLGWLNQAAHAAALIQQTTETETPLPELFETFRGLLEHLPRQAPQPQTVFAFEMKLLAELGLQPDLAETSLKPETRPLLKRCLEGGWPEIAALLFTPAQVQEVRRFLHGFLIFHLGRIPPTRTLALGGHD